MATGKRRLKVFLCHTRADSDSIRILYDRLTHDGLDVWLDRVRLLPGQDSEREIHKAVSESDIVIVCHSRQFKQEGVHHKEVEFALEKASSFPKGDVFIIPVRLEECDLLEDLRHLYQVDLFVSQDSYAGYESLLSSLRLRAHKIGAIIRGKRSRSMKISFLRSRSKRIIPDDILKNWFVRHGIVTNPFRNADINNYPLYPQSAVRPNQWEFLLDSVPILARCPTAEDSYALAYLLRNECLPLKNDNSMAGVHHHIFPVWVWRQQVMPVQPLWTLAHSAVQTWLNVLPTHPNALLDLPLAEQNALLDLLHWSLGSNDELVNLVQLNSLSENENSLILIRKIERFKSEFMLNGMLQDAILLSWLKIRPFGMNKTYLIFPGDDPFYTASARRFEKFSSLISILSLHEIFAKMFTSSSSLALLSLQEMELSWSDERLKRSLTGQFDAAMHLKEKSIGKSVYFHELFGFGATEQDTTDRLISASNHSLARMLTLGNRLLQEHCNKAVIEKYLSIDELDDILRQHERIH